MKKRKAILLLFMQSSLLLPAQRTYQDVLTVKSDSLSQSMISTGSTDMITEGRMNKGLVTNPLAALSGQAAGVNISSSGADRMAMLNSVRVRGTTSVSGGNDPLVIIDGVSSDLATLSTIYPADIESFTILKNAAETAQYGSRGASGVIEVKTKKGHGGIFHISYDGSGGVESIYKTLHMLNAPEYVATAKQLGIYHNDGGYDTDFQREITRTGFVQNHHVAFSGGTESSNYRASIAFMDHKTVLKINQFQNFVAKLDLTQKAFDDLLTIDLGVFGSSQKNNYIFDEWKLFYSAAAMNPTLPYYPTAPGSWSRNANASQINPPDALLKEKNDEQNLNFNTHIAFTADLSPYLQLKLFGSYSFSSTENAQFCPTWVWAQGQAFRGEHKAFNYLGNAMLNYHRSFGIHSLNATLLAEYQKQNNKGFWTLVKGFASNDFGYDNLSAGAFHPYGSTGSDFEDPALASFMGSISYQFKNRYTLTLTTRADGSSMIARSNRWGFFPSVSANWDVTKEKWFERLPQSPLKPSTLKIRTGYGISGNLGGISPYNSLQRFLPSGIVSIDNTPVITLSILKNQNKDLKWETRSSFNIGTDMGFLHNRIVLTAEYYTSKTRDMLYLYDVPVPPYAYSKMLANLGSMSNKGFEVGIGVTPLQKKDMELNLNLNIAWQKNKLISLSGEHNGVYLTADDITSIGSLNGAGFHGGNNNIVYQIVGQPLGVFYLPHCTGLKQNADGSYSYEVADLDDNGVINMEDGGDRYIAGQATPKVTLGSNISFRYKQFDISLQMNGAFGHKIYNGTSLTYMNMGSFPDYNVMEKAPAANIKDQTATDYWLESGDYLNFDYLTIGWNVPVRSRYMSSLRLSCSVNNLATITGYSGLTPMINSYVVSNTMGIDDKRSYPCYRSYSIGVSISF